MIIQKNKTKLKQPVVLCSWPGAGMVGRYVINYLVSQLNPVVYAEVDLQEYVIIHNVVVENGLIYSPSYMKEKIFYVREAHTDFLFFFSDFQPAVNNMVKLATDFLDFLQRLNVQYILTFNGLPSNILHTDIPKVYLAYTFPSKQIKNIITQPLEKLSSGVIEGMNGIILSTAKEFGIDGICLLAEVPFYTIEMYNPQCAKVLLNYLEQMFGFNIDYSKVMQDILLLDEHLRTTFSDINRKAQRLFSQMHPQDGFTEDMDKRKDIIDSNISGITFEELKKKLKFSLPMSAKNKINELFKLASENIEYAKQLKEELDRWGVYKEYEDKFLSLFLKNKHSQERKEKKE
ncbi:MAG: PAC2 family protein [Endomicrobia bacterium]|nr:PAC2 family protein [Endomicrobiia bacterium]